MVNHFGERVKQARGNMTQQEFAEKLGVTPNHVQLVEYGKSLLSLDKFVTLCEITEKSPNFFLQDDLAIAKVENNKELFEKISNFDDEQLNLLSVTLEAINKYNDSKE